MAKAEKKNKVAKVDKVPKVDKEITKEKKKKKSLKPEVEDVAVDAEAQETPAAEDDTMEATPKKRKSTDGSEKKKKKRKSEGGDEEVAGAEAMEVCVVPEPCSIGDVSRLCTPAASTEQLPCSQVFRASSV
jgi:hypothetical protein